MNKNVLRTVLAASVLGGFVAAAPVVVGSGSDPGASSLATPAGEASAAEPAAPRTVLVSSHRMPAVSRPGVLLHALRLSGPVPSRPQAATVLTDEDCAPDAQGVSRCVNRIRLADGQTLSVRHPHRMMEVPCLSPGERVRVRRA